MTTIEPVKTTTTEQLAFRGKFAEQKAAKLFDESLQTKAKNIRNNFLQNIKGKGITKDFAKQIEAYKAYFNIKSK